MNSRLYTQKKVLLNQQKFQQNIFLGAKPPSVKRVIYIYIYIYIIHTHAHRYIYICVRVCISLFFLSCDSTHNYKTFSMILHIWTGLTQIFRVCWSYSFTGLFQNGGHLKTSNKIAYVIMNRLHWYSVYEQVWYRLRQSSLISFVRDLVSKCGYLKISNSNENRINEPIWIKLDTNKVPTKCSTKFVAYDKINPFNLNHNSRFSERKPPLPPCRCRKDFVDNA